MSAVLWRGKSASVTDLVTEESRKSDRIICARMRALANQRLDCLSQTSALQPRPQFRKERH